MIDSLAAMPSGMTPQIVLALVLAGASIGVLAGLFGIGGGAISVPVFFETLRAMEVAEAVAMPMAVGTSLAMIVPTSILSARSHHARGTVDTAVLAAWIAPVFLGVVLGAVIARRAPPVVFQAVFVAVAGVNALRMLLGSPGWRLRDSLPGRGVLRLYGFCVGLISALMGIGGGAISNLILTLNGMDMRRAVSTSAGVGVLIALPGAAGYVLAGWGKPGLPTASLGYVSLLALVLTMPAALLTTRVGVALAHSLPERLLTRAFGAFLALVCLRFGWEIVT